MIRCSLTAELAFLFVKNALGRLRTLYDFGRFRTPKDGMMMGRERNGHGYGTKMLTPL